MGCIVSCGLEFQACKLKQFSGEPSILKFLTCPSTQKKKEEEVTVAMLLQQAQISQLLSTFISRAAPIWPNFVAQLFSQFFSKTSSVDRLRGTQTEKDPNTDSASNPQPLVCSTGLPLASTG